MSKIETTSDTVNIDVAEAFDTVVKWLQLDETLTLADAEMARLRESFSKAVLGESYVMIASNHKNKVFVSAQAALCMDGEYDKETLLRRHKGKASARDCINRDGFFLFDVKNKNPLAKPDPLSDINILYDTQIIPPDRKMRLG